jgi:hypothetical protein
VRRSKRKEKVYPRTREHEGVPEPSSRVSGGKSIDERSQGGSKALSISGGEMPPTTRSSLHFETTADGGLRVLEGGNARNLTGEELNHFARQWINSNHELKEVEAATAQFTADKEEMRKRLAKMEEAARRGEDKMREKESILEEMSNDRGRSTQAPRSQVGGPRRRLYEVGPRRTR